MKYRKKSVVVEAVLVPPKWNGDKVPHALAAVMVFLGDGPWTWTADGGVDIGTLEGVMHATPGDWIIRGVKGEFYPCKPDVFAATYEDAE